MNMIFTTFHYVVIFPCKLEFVVMCAVFYAAVDDTQRMMQMGGFGFDPSKVQLQI